MLRLLVPKFKCNVQKLNIFESDAPQSVNSNAFCLCGKKIGTGSKFNFWL